MIKTVVSTYGEFIGDVDEGADVVVIKKPKMVIQSEKGFGFAKGVCKLLLQNQNLFLIE